MGVGGAGGRRGGGRSLIIRLLTDSFLSWEAGWGVGRDSLFDC